MQETTTTALPHRIQRNEGTPENKGCNKGEECKKHCSLRVEGLLFSRLSFFGLVKFTKKGLPSTELSTDQAERDTGDGERKWTPLSSKVR